MFQTKHLVTICIVVLAAIATSWEIFSQNNNMHAINIQTNRTISNSDTRSNSNITSSHSSIVNPSLHLAFFVDYEKPQYRTNLEILIKNLHSGDYLLIEGDPSNMSGVLEQKKDVQSRVDSGVHVISVANYRKISDISTVPELPGGVDYIMYDYEAGKLYSPEFTKDENISISYFDKARESIHQYNIKTGSNAKLFVTPPYGQLRKSNWDWGAASLHMDVIDMQLQSFLKDPDFEKYATDVISQIKEKSPDKMVFIQVSINPLRGTLQDNINSITTLQAKNMNNVLVFYLPPQGEQLSEFFKLLNR